jgi:hypothetical protein
MANTDVISQMLADLNGIDAYIPAEVADEPLAANVAMFLTPYAYGNFVVDSNEEVYTIKKAPTKEIIDLAVVNFVELNTNAAGKSLIPELAILRALIASRGFLLSGGEVKFEVNKPVYAPHTKRPEIYLKSPSTAIKYDQTGKIASYDPILQPLITAFSKVNELAMLATLLPVFAAIQFQKTNHHYVDNAEYREAYKRHFKSAMISNLNDTYNNAFFIYHAIHWLGPFTMQIIIENLHAAGLKYLPRGIMLKLNPTPAGTALIKSQIAVWNAISTFPAASPLFALYTNQIGLLYELDNEINGDRLSYHVYATMYGKTCKLDNKEFLDKVNSVAGLAAIAQAFLTTVAKDSDLAGIKALKKHSDANIGLFRLAEAAFKGAMKQLSKETLMSAVTTGVTKKYSEESIKQITDKPETEQTPEEKRILAVKKRMPLMFEKLLPLPKEKKSEKMEEVE